MSSNDLELARAEVRYQRDRLALLRAKHYRWGLGSSPRLQQLERELQRAEQRLSEIRSRERVEVTRNRRPPDDP
jgi:hypothetical protein